ncbi:Na+/H+ antiporter subunit G [Saccharospirillum impatiens]|uniref:Na+/H+ antiporter subunit G n=1 Tax=Saccharospirillum impatiens TaxID=169438 RepID=UPI0004087A83|nr:Na+/H+ antiporter subunit G [Saccharospirillum impatiens]
MNLFVEWLVIILLLLGAFFLMVGSIGLAKLPDFYTRLHAPTKASTLGIGAVLIASTLFFSVNQDGISVKELVITLFLFITAPITAHMMGKAAMHKEKPALERTQNRHLQDPARHRQPPT